jgi:hypothetical protein
VKSVRGIFPFNDKLQNLYLMGKFNIAILGLLLFLLLFQLSNSYRFNHEVEVGGWHCRRLFCDDILKLSQCFLYSVCIIMLSVFYWQQRSKRKLHWQAWMYGKYLCVESPQNASSFSTFKSKIIQPSSL